VFPTFRVSVVKCQECFITVYNIDRSYQYPDLLKTHVLSEYKKKKKCVLLFLATLSLYRKANEGA